LIKNLRQFKEYGSRKILMEFSEKSGEGRAGHFTEKDLGNRKHRPGTRAADRSTHVLKRTWPLWVNW